MAATQTRLAWFLLLIGVGLAMPAHADETAPAPAPAPGVESPDSASPDSASPEKATPKDADTGEAEVAAVATLREAVRDGRLEAEGFNPTSYQRVHLRLKNRTAAPLSVDICGSHLEPRSKRSCQRLGLGPVVTPRKARKAGPGTMVVDLEPGESTELEVHTCCLDAGRSAPSNQTFKAARSKLPAVREGVLRWWADNPTAPQGAVNSAIWQSRPDVYWDPSGKTTRVDRSYASAVAGNAGTHYLLKNGELLSRDPDGIVRFLGTDILDVYPTDSAVYAEAFGPIASPSRPRSRELWRLVPTGDDPWKRVARLPHEISIRELRVGPTGAVLLVAHDGLYRVDPATEAVRKVATAPDNDSLSIRFLKRGRVLYTLKKRGSAGYQQGGELKGAQMAVCELHELDLASNTTRHIRTFWNVESIRMGAAGVFALTGGGKLRRLQGKSFRNIGGTAAFDRIVAVGRKCLWVERGDRLVAVSPAGHVRFQNGPRSPDRLRLDRHADAAIYLASSKFWRMEAKDSARKEIEMR